jgi:hypothetical protein
LCIGISERRTRPGAAADRPALREPAAGTRSSGLPGVMQGAMGFGPAPPQCAKIANNNPAPAMPVQTNEIVSRRVSRLIGRSYAPELTQTLQDRMRRPQNEKISQIASATLRVPIKIAPNANSRSPLTITRYSARDSVTRAYKNNIAGAVTGSRTRLGYGQMRQRRGASVPRSLLRAIISANFRARSMMFVQPPMQPEGRLTNRALFYRALS